ncbi:MAG: VPLPA-CTERM sorting domain-containing protein [Pseudomonadota bacterium]
MTIKPFIKAIAALAVSGMMLSASANSVGFDAMDYDGTAGTVSITLTYDFTDFAMFGGGVDIIYDSNAIEFVSYTQADLPADAQAPASPVGALDGAGTYAGVGIGTFEFFNGMTSAGNIGTFVFNVLGGTDAGATPCGMTLCIVPNAINPFVSLAGQDVTADLLSAGISGANVVVPVPAAVWFMLSGLGALIGFGRKSS